MKEHIVLKGTWLQVTLNDTNVAETDQGYYNHIKNLEVAIVRFGSVVQNCWGEHRCNSPRLSLCVKDSIPNSRELREEESKIKKMPGPSFWLTASFLLRDKLSRRRCWNFKSNFDFGNNTWLDLLRSELRLFCDLQLSQFPLSHGIYQNFSFSVFASSRTTQRI